MKKSNIYVPGDDEIPRGFEKVVIRYTIPLKGVFVSEPTILFSFIAVSNASGIIPSPSVGTEKIQFPYMYVCV